MADEGFKRKLGAIIRRCSAKVESYGLAELVCHVIIQRITLGEYQQLVSFYRKFCTYRPIGSCAKPFYPIFWS